MRIAVCGGIYSNPYALAAFCADARRWGADALYCLGDLGGYGAEPDAVWPLLLDNDITCVAGNYDVAIAAGETDCGCGYSDPRDRQFAQIMFDYTVAHTAARLRMSGCPPGKTGGAALEPTLRHDGWRCRADRDSPPLIDPRTGDPVPPADTPRAYELFAALLLTEFAGLGTGEPLTCPVAAEPTSALGSL